MAPKRKMLRVAPRILTLAVVLTMLAMVGGVRDTGSSAGTDPTPTTTPPAGNTPTTTTPSRTPTTSPSTTLTTAPTAAGNTSTTANSTKTTKPVAAGATTKTTATAATIIDNSAVNVDPKSEYGTKATPLMNETSSNTTSSMTASSIGSWLVPAIIGVVIVGALVFVSFMKNNKDEDRDGAARRGTSFFEHPRTHKHIQSKHDDLDSTPVLGASLGPPPPPPQNAPMPMAKQSSTMLTASTARSQSPMDRFSARSEDSSAMLEAPHSSYPQSVGSSFKTPEPGTSVIL